MVYTLGKSTSLRKKSMQRKAEQRDGKRNRVLVTSFKEIDSMVPEARAISLDCSIT